MHKKNTIRIIPKKYVFFFLFGVFSFAFIYSPYWYAFGTFGFPNLKYIAFFLLFLFGLLWAYLSASHMRLPKVQIHIIPLFLLSLFLYAANFKQLNADILWRGDEDGHVTILLRLKEYLIFFFKRADIYLIHNPLFWILVVLILLVLYFILVYRRKIVAHPVFISTVLFIITIPSLIVFSERSFTDQKNIFLLSELLRYPFIEKWINLLFIVPNFFEDIRLYRAVPFLSTLAIAIFLFYAFRQQLKSKLLSFLFSLAFSTVPLILYYSNILYLEMPIVFLMTVCVFHAKTIIKEDFEKLKSHPVWYCLLILSFLKETALIFLLLVIIMRFTYQIAIRYRLIFTMQVMLSEIKLAILVVSPAFIYLLFRNLFLPEFARYSFYMKNILTLSNYGEIIQSLLTQTGIVVIIGVFGLVYFAWKRDTFRLVVLTVLMIGVMLFFLGYQYIPYILSGRATMFVGYSRWNLYLLPMLIFLSFYFITYVKRSYRIVLLLLLVGSNILLFPFKSDGVRLPNWGSPHIDTAEYAYPYDEAIRFLSGEKTDTLLLLGQYSPYWGLRYYFKKYNFHPKTLDHPFGSTRFDEKTEQRMFDLFFDKPILWADTILYHSTNGIDLDMSALYGGKYKIIRRVRNSLHSIYLFSKVK